VRYRKVATGGTFDHIHAGHRRLLEESFRVGQEVVIGLTSDAFVSRLGKKPDYPYARRRAELKKFVKKHFPRRKFVIAKLDDYFGPGIANPEMEALVASPETSARLPLANKLRSEKGFPPLKLVAVDWIKAEDGLPISSTRIRRGEIDPEGKLAG